MAREYGEAYSPDFRPNAHESPQNGEWSDDTLALRVDACLGDICKPMTEQVPDSEDKPVQDAPQKPILLERLAVVLAIWAITGFVVFSNYQTDTCPPEVKHREGIRAGILAPLILADRAAQSVSFVSLGSVIGLSFLACFFLLLVLVLRSRSRYALCKTGLALALLSAAGIWCVFYMRVHPVG